MILVITSFTVFLVGPAFSTTSFTAFRILLFVVLVLVFTSPYCLPFSRHATSHTLPRGGCLNGTASSGERGLFTRRCWIALTCVVLEICVLDWNIQPTIPVMVPPLILGKLLHNFLGGPVAHKSCEKWVLLPGLVLVSVTLLFLEIYLLTMSYSIPLSLAGT
jgi:hypothetical protein